MSRNTGFRDRLAKLDNDAFILLCETFRTTHDHLDNARFTADELLAEAEKRLDAQCMMPTFEEQSLWLRDERIPAIKHLHKRTSCGLNNAKDALDLSLTMDRQWSRSLLGLGLLQDVS